MFVVFEQKKKNHNWLKSVFFYICGRGGRGGGSLVCRDNLRVVGVWRWVGLRGDGGGSPAGRRLNLPPGQGEVQEEEGGQGTSCRSGGATDSGEDLALSSGDGGMAGLLG